MTNLNKQALISYTEISNFWAVYPYSSLVYHPFPPWIFCFWFFDFHICRGHNHLHTEHTFIYVTETFISLAGNSISVQIALYLFPLPCVVQTVDNDLALKIYIKARATPKVVAAFAERREFDKILIYSKQVMKHFLLGFIEPWK